MSINYSVRIAALAALCVFPFLAFADEPVKIQCEPVPCDTHFKDNNPIPPECREKPKDKVLECMKDYCQEDRKKKKEDRNPLCLKKVAVLSAIGGVEGVIKQWANNKGKTDSPISTYVDMAAKEESETQDGKTVVGETPFKAFNNHRPEKNSKITIDSEGSLIISH